MAQQLYYQTYRTLDSGFEHFHIEVFDNLEANSSEFVTFTWQNDSNSSKWYAGRVIIEAQSLNWLQAKVKTASRIIRNLEEHYDFFLEEILSKLDRLKAIEVTYDGRQSKYVPLNEVPGPHLQRWMDDQNIMDAPYIKYSALAADREEAQKLILQQAVENGDHKWIAKFAQKGCPVWSSRDKTPETTPAREKARIEAAEEVVLVSQADQWLQPA